MIFRILCLLMLLYVSLVNANEQKRIIKKQVQIEDGINSYQDKAVYYLSEAILASGDMCVKMGVLHRFFCKTQDWNIAIKKIINNEKWLWAKVTMLNFYLKKEDFRDDKFIIKMIDKIAKNPQDLESGDGSGWDSLLEWRKNYDNYAKAKHQKLEKKLKSTKHIESCKILKVTLEYFLKDKPAKGVVLTPINDTNVEIVIGLNLQDYIDFNHFVSLLNYDNFSFEKWTGRKDIKIDIIKMNDKNAVVCLDGSFVKMGQKVLLEKIKDEWNVSKVENIRYTD